MTAVTKVMESQFVNAAHKVVSLILAPIIVALLIWTGSTFVEILRKVDKIETAIAIQIPHLQHADQQLDTRVSRVEGWVFGRDR